MAVIKRTLPGGDPSYRKRAPGEGEAIPGAGVGSFGATAREWDPAVG